MGRKLSKNLSRRSKFGVFLGWAACGLTGTGKRRERRRSANKEQSGGEDGQRAACIPESVSIFAGFQSWNAIVRIEAPGDLFS
jgi:hypothetical protein